MKTLGQRLDIEDFSKLTTQERLDSIRHPAILKLHQETLAEIFPHEGPYKPNGMRGIPRKRTNTPITDEYREKRRNKDREGRRNRQRTEMRKLKERMLKGLVPHG